MHRNVSLVLGLFTIGLALFPFGAFGQGSMLSKATRIRDSLEPALAFPAQE
jgi:hypothetical protein